MGCIRFKYLKCVEFPHYGGQVMLGIYILVIDLEISQALYFDESSE